MRQLGAVQNIWGKPLDRMPHIKVVRKFTTSLYVVSYALSAMQAERGLKLFACLLFLKYLTYSLVIINSVRLIITRANRPLLNRAQKIYKFVVLLRMLGDQRSALYHSKAYLVLGVAPHPSPKTIPQPSP